MDSKLKTLKVVDLKDILNKASVPLPPKANKADLIAAILAHPNAIAEYEKRIPSSSKTPSARPQAPAIAPVNNEPSTTSAPPVKTGSLVPKGNASVVSTSASKTQPTIIPPPSIKETRAPATPSSQVKVASDNQATTPVADSAQPASNGTATSQAQEESEKLKIRAERFGLPLVKEHSTPTKIAPSPTAATPLDEDKLKARAARFGTVQNVSANPTSRKRSAATEDVDPEELERRKKRAERFGIPFMGLKT